MIYTYRVFSLPDDRGHREVEGRPRSEQRQNHRGGGGDGAGGGEAGAHGRPRGGELPGQGQPNGVEELQQGIYYLLL